jgi:hypothetical protein
MEVMRRHSRWRMTVAVMVPLPVGLLAGMIIRLVVLDGEFGRRHARSQHRRGRNRGVDGQTPERASKLVDRHAGINQRAQDHVA